MNVHIEGSDTMSLVLAALFFAGSLGPIFIWPMAAFSMTVSIVALRKKLVGLSIVFSITPLALLANGFFQFLSLSTDSNWRLAEAICTWVLGLSTLVPFILALFVLKKITAKHLFHAIGGSARSE